ncbi:unnamed protein product [Toxocara canis]|uniref:Uncharacterized protein n=1 Tax=Toxocara canis TaxID=6265 RepID=A0A183U2F7_TOXCA|nr:unnamed protein product [Toxocara canis]
MVTLKRMCCAINKHVPNGSSGPNGVLAAKHVEQPPSFVLGS